MDKLEKPLYQPLYDAVNAGRAILTAGKIHDDIPTIHDIGVGRLISTDTEVVHAGYGLFLAHVGDNTISFDGGGAMSHEGENGAHIYSWTHLQSTAEQREAMGYDMEAVRNAVNELMGDAR